MLPVTLEDIYNGKKAELPIQRERDGKPRETKKLEVYIEKGMPDKHRFTLMGEGDQEKGKEAGDVIVVLEEQPHPVFHVSSLL